MASACFQSMTLGGLRSAKNSLGHCERAYGGHGREPDYLLPLEHRLPNQTTVWTRPEELQAEIKAQGKLHNRAKPFREAVIVLEETTSDQQVEDCIDTLCQDLGIRKLYASVHNDEGHISVGGDVVRNRHLHLGYTNWTPEGSVHMDKTKMRLAQDIVANTLGMDRGESKEITGRKHIGHKTWRMMQQEQGRLKSLNHKSATWMMESQKALREADAVAGETIESLQDQLVEEQEWRRSEARELQQINIENAELRERLKISHQAKQRDYMELKKITEENIELKEKLEKMHTFVESVEERGETESELRDRLSKTTVQFYQAQNESLSVKDDSELAATLIDHISTKEDRLLDADKTDLLEEMRGFLTSVVKTEETKETRSTPRRRR